MIILELASLCLVVGGIHEFHLLMITHNLTSCIISRILDAWWWFKDSPNMSEKIHCETCGICCTINAFCWCLIEWTLVSLNICVKKFSSMCCVRNFFKYMYYKNYQIKEHGIKIFGLRSVTRISWITSWQKAKKMSHVSCEQIRVVTPSVKMSTFFSINVFIPAHGG